MLKNCALFVDVVLHIMRLFLLRRSLVTTRAMSSSAWAAVCQMTVTSDVKANLEQATGLVETAANKGAAMVFLPECFDFIGENSKQTNDLSQSIQGETISYFKNLAIDNKVYLSLGGFHNKKTDTDAKISNTHVIIGSDGALVGDYSKMHLFDVDIPGKVRLKESDYVDPGQIIAPPVDTPVGKVGLGICYDMRFPELSLSLVKMGAQVLTYPSAFTVPTGMAHWEALLRARAIETQTYVIAAAQTGQHNKKRSSYGHAMIVDPWGAVVAQCREGVNVALAEIDLGYVEKVRENMPVMDQRRPDLYGSVGGNCHAPALSDHPLPGDDALFDFGPVSVPGPCVFYRSGMSLAFVNKKPVVEGHVLVIPVRKVPRLKDMRPEEVADLFMVVQKVAKFVEEYHGSTSTTVSIQDGPEAGQSIPHVHVHILPRRKGDFGNNDDVYKELETHDKGEVKWREVEEMVKEAQEYRKAWKD